MEVRVTFDDFVKIYFVDLFAADGVIVETKVVETLRPAHRAQVLNYLYLCDLRNSTLLNFRPEKVQHEFVSTTLSLEDRRKPEWNLEGWKPMSPECNTLKKTFHALIDDWGFGLNPKLYRDAISHFLGGDLSVIREVEIYSGNKVIGKQNVHHVREGIGFSATSSVHRPESVRQHHQRFLAHTKLRAIHWINLNRKNITIETIQKP